MKTFSNNAVFGKTMENVRKHTYIKLVTNEARRNYLVSEPKYHTTIIFSENLLAIEMKKKTLTRMNKPVYLGVSKKRDYIRWIQAVSQSTQ